MLTLILGKAGSGKTAAVISEINTAVQQRQGRRMLIVPEQYSHEAERELCAACGDSLSLYAEVFSFTGLARRLMSQLGGGAAKYLDKGGRLLCMALALNSVGSRLKIYSGAERKVELQSLLLRAVDELKASCVSTDELAETAQELNDSLGDKLSDLALIAEAYDAVVANGHADPSDALTVLARQIPESDINSENHIYIDGFVDFTAQEREVIRALMEKGAEITVCLTLDTLSSESEVFDLSRRAARLLIDAAEELGVKWQCITQEGESAKEPSLSFFADNMFSYTDVLFNGASAIDLVEADGMNAECELAAAKALELVRTKNCRWRDIAIAVRGFDDYRASLENIFRHYGVPLFTAKKSELAYKPLPLMISLVYEIIEGGWDIDDVISYMHTGLTGLNTDECDILEDYIFKWQLRGNTWTRSSDWRQHPDGIGEEYTEDTERRLAEINSLRRRLAGPLLSFKTRSDEAKTAAEQASALAEFFAELKLPEILEERAKRLTEDGREEQAQEYVQLWGIVVAALEQCAAILADTGMDRAAFGKLFNLMLSKYDIGIIPVSLDRVSAGDFDRMRRRSIKHLIVLGASDNRIPGTGSEAGMFTDAERSRLSEYGLELGGNSESELWREFTLIYNCLTLPSESLTMIYPLVDSNGEAQRPAFVYNRAAALFGITPVHVSTDEARLTAEAPALTLAAQAVHGGSAAAHAAEEYFRQEKPERFAAVLRASEMSRGRLSSQAVKLLYGDTPRLSPSKIDKFASCKYAYFCQYGLKAKPHEPSRFTPPEIGTFMHDVLENTVREVKERGGFRDIDNEQLGKICDKYVEKYVHEKLNDFQEKSARFIHLFNRLSQDARRIVCDTADELRRSDFEPLSFELDFGKAQDLPPVELGGEDDKLRVTGIADRVDGWLHEGKLYLRVVDYKTGKKQFSMSDIWYGMGLQMLLYLFVLEEDGEKLYGHETVPAGVMYVPARSGIISVTQSDDEDAVIKKRTDDLRRSGIVLNDAALVEAWEHGEDKRYIPVRTRMPSNNLVSLEQLGILSRHIKRRLNEMARELKKGNIAADPYYRGQQENACLNCDYADACRFSDGSSGESCRYLEKLKPDKVWSLLQEADGEEAKAHE
jgi:ATP-dependent helicase/nuclease subunit B